MPVPVIFNYYLEGQKHALAAAGAVSYQNGNKGNIRTGQGVYPN